MIPENIITELKKNAHQNKYLPMQGLPELRESVSNFESKTLNIKVTDKTMITIRIRNLILIIF